jgi:hypothetical protein
MEALVSPDSEAAIDEALEESFPASDPPPWTLGVISQEADMKVRCRTVDSVLTEVEGCSDISHSVPRRSFEHEEVPSETRSRTG